MNYPVLVGCIVGSSLGTYITKGPLWLIPLCTCLSYFFDLWLIKALGL